MPSLQPFAPPKRLNEAFGQVLRAMRLERGLSQEALAEACDLHWTYIGLLERGKNSPTLRTLYVLAAALGREPPEILRRLQSQLPDVRKK